MVIPVTYCNYSPYSTGVIFDVTVGLLIGNLSSGFVLAIFWLMPEDLDNAKSMWKKVTLAVKGVRFIRQLSWGYVVIHLKIPGQSEYFNQAYEYGIINGRLSWAYSKIKNIG